MNCRSKKGTTEDLLKACDFSPALIHTPGTEHRSRKQDFCFPSLILKCDDQVRLR